MGGDGGGVVAGSGGEVGVGDVALGGGVEGGALEEERGGLLAAGCGVDEEGEDGGNAGFLG